jgi:aspartyl-tRNA(Asn)/glutamyl-tRNA(Gln) amidotransferase subunit A
MPYAPFPSLRATAEALRSRRASAVEIAEEAIRRHEERDRRHRAYKLFDAAGARAMAAQADRMLAESSSAPPLCGIPVSVKDLYGVDGMPTFAGTPRRLPDSWSKDAWLVARMRAQGVVFTGKTHTVELAYGAVGMNPNWETPRNPWDADVHRIPGGSSAGAGVSLHEGSAMVALGTDTGGSIRIPASMTGMVGHKTTVGRLPTDGVVPLSHTLDTVGALTRSVEDSIWFFGAVDSSWGDPEALLSHLAARGADGMRFAVPRCGIWNDCQSDIGAALTESLGELERAGWGRTEVDGALLDQAVDLYMTGAIAGVECLAFLERDLPGWLEILHPIVGKRIAAAAAHTQEAYRQALSRRESLAAAAAGLFDGIDVLALPTAIVTPPPVEELEDLGRYVDTNAAALRPTCPVSILGLCAVTVPVGLDRTGMPVGLQLVGPDGQDERVLAAALAVERALGTAAERLGMPPEGA